jgi:hypothetical protein
MLRALTLIAAASLTLGACSDKQSTKPPKPNGLVFPVACTIGKDCWIARYTDRDTGPGAADHTCGPETQDGHDGTDITLADFGVMRRGIPVYAAANGKVLTTRDGEKDISVRDRKGGLAEIKGRECGNGVLLRHDDGSESQYCHLQEGSLTIGPGFRVAAGQQIGTVGLSGETEYPHLHFTLRRDGVVIDPFDGKPMADACSSADACAPGHGGAAKARGNLGPCRVSAQGCRRAFYHRPCLPHRSR